MRIFFNLLPDCCRFGLFDSPLPHHVVVVSVPRRVVCVWTGRRPRPGPEKNEHRRQEMPQHGRSGPPTVDGRLIVHVVHCRKKSKMICRVFLILITHCFSVCFWTLELQDLNKGLFDCSDNTCFFREKTNDEISIGHFFLDWWLSALGFP